MPCSIIFCAKTNLNKPTNVTIKADKTKLLLGESITFTLTQSGGNAASLGIDKNGTRVDNPMVTNLTSYTYTPKSTGTYTVYQQAVNSAGYTDSPKITFTVSNPPRIQSFVSSISQSDNTISAAITRKTDASYPIAIVIAQYDSYKKLVGIKLEYISDSNSQTEYTFSVPVSVGASKAKVFVWNKNTFDPLAYVNETAIQ